MMQSSETARAVRAVLDARADYQSKKEAANKALVMMEDAYRQLDSVMHRNNVHPPVVIHVDAGSWLVEREDGEVYIKKVKVVE